MNRYVHTIILLSSCFLGGRNTYASTSEGGHSNGLLSITHAKAAVSTDPYRSVAVHPTTALIAAGTISGDIDIFNPDGNFRQKMEDAHLSSIDHVAFNPTNAELVSASDTDIGVWNLDTLAYDRYKLTTSKIGVDKLEFVPGSDSFTVLFKDRSMTVLKTEKRGQLSRHNIIPPEWHIYTFGMNPESQLPVITYIHDKKIFQQYACPDQKGRMEPCAPVERTSLCTQPSFFATHPTKDAFAAATPEGLLMSGDYQSIPTNSLILGDISQIKFSPYGNRLIIATKGGKVFLLGLNEAGMIGQDEKQVSMQLSGDELLSKFDTSVKADTLAILSSAGKLQLCTEQLDGNYTQMPLSAPDMPETGSDSNWDRIRNKLLTITNDAAGTILDPTNDTIDDTEQAMINAAIAASLLSSQAQKEANSREHS